MKIFEIDIIREKIVKHLNNADASNLMAAVRPTPVWEHFFKDKIRQKRSVFCPICMMNSNAPLLNRSIISQIIGEDWMAPINSIFYPHQYVLDHKAYDEQLDDPFERSPFVLSESGNLFNHKNHSSLTPRSPLEDIKSYFDRIELGAQQTQFKTEKDLLAHIYEVGIQFNVYHTKHYFQCHTYDDKSNESKIETLKAQGEAGHLRQLMKDLEQDLKPNVYLEGMVIAGLLHSKERTQSLKRSCSLANLESSK